MKEYAARMLKIFAWLLMVIPTPLEEFFLFSGFHISVTYVTFRRVLNH